MVINTSTTATLAKTTTKEPQALSSLDRSNEKYLELPLPDSEVKETREYRAESNNLRVKQDAEEKGSTQASRSTIDGLETNNRAHIFYYSWWGTPDGPLEKRYAHWNHDVLPHWTKEVNDRFKHVIGTLHQPPEDLGTNFYPQGGPYSSSSPATIARHMKEIRSAGIGVVVLSWYPPQQADSNGDPELADPLLRTLLDACHRENLSLAIHLEPYKDRTAQSVWSDADYIEKMYGDHPALLRVGPHRLPLIYVYDSYLIPYSQWQDVGGRHEKKNAVYLGLVVEERHLGEIDQARSFFDGYYTYFAAERFVWGSTRSNWKRIADHARDLGLISSISVGPGYEDTRIRPWNDINTRPRDGGRYYRESFRKASEAKPDYVSITSYNEWHEGTQIEPAIPKPGYNDYKDLAMGPEGYLFLTKQLIEEFLS